MLSTSSNFMMSLSKSSYGNDIFGPDKPDESDDPIARSQHGTPDISLSIFSAGGTAKSASSKATASFTGILVDGCMNP